MNGFAGGRRREGPRGRRPTPSAVHLEQRVLKNVYSSGAHIRILAHSHISKNN